ncbi:MAG: PHP domain-containing protein [Gemmataceae bacterium]|nr:PHP domain-containing protein [Gemmataceae bacterium]
MTNQPFTQLCAALHRPRYFGRVDLHMHTTFSDGRYTPAQIVSLAQRSGLSAIAITDHDTLGAIAGARLMTTSELEIISGVEITAEYRGKELHLLGYFFDVDNEALTQSLDRLRIDRIGRFHEMIARLRALGVPISEADVAALPTDTALGRRHLADLIVRAKRASTIREAFQRWLGDNCRAAVPKTRLPVADAIMRVRDAGGVASWAHPPHDSTREQLANLHSLGLGAVEVEYPTIKASRAKQLRQWADELGLAISGGSDCHGPDEPHRAVGASTIHRDELERLRAFSRSTLASAEPG